MIDSLWQQILAHKALLGGLSVCFSVLLVLASIVGLPWFIARLPADYFSRVLSQRSPGRLTPLRLLARIGKNAAGVVLGIAGLVMMILPGQGVLTLFVALTLLDFPGKRRAERWLIQREPVRRGLDWLRRRTNKPPFVWDHLD